MGIWGGVDGLRGLFFGGFGEGRFGKRRFGKKRFGDRSGIGDLLGHIENLVY